MIKGWNHIGNVLVSFRVKIKLDTFIHFWCISFLASPAKSSYIDNSIYNITNYNGGGYRMTIAGQQSWDERHVEFLHAEDDKGYECKFLCSVLSLYMCK